MAIHARKLEATQDRQEGEAIMPIYFFSCADCLEEARKLLKPEALDSMVFFCPKCHKPMERSPQPPTSRVTETLDNGIMVRKVERLADAEQIHRERAKGKKGVI